MLIGLWVSATEALLTGDLKGLVTYFLVLVVVLRDTLAGEAVLFTDSLLGLNWSMQSGGSNYN